MYMLYRRYGDDVAVLICDSYNEPPQKWTLVASGQRGTFIEFARAAGIRPIFAPASGRYADIRASVIGFERHRRRKLERRAEELRRCLDPAHLDEHGPTADEVEEMRRELENIGEQLAELAQEDER